MPVDPDRKCGVCGTLTHHGTERKVGDAWLCIDCMATHIAALEAIVAKLPRSADGVVVVAGVWLWEVFEGEIRRRWVNQVVLYPCGFRYHVGPDGKYGHVETVDPCTNGRHFYSTESDAAAAAAGAF